MHNLFLLQSEYMGVWQGTQTELTKAVRNLLGHLGTAALWTNYSLKGARGKAGSGPDQSLRSYKK